MAVLNCTDVSAILPSSGWHEEITSSLFVVVCNFERLFLDMYLIPRDDLIATSINYKKTDSHSYLNFKSSHAFKCKAAIPTSQFLRLRKICSAEDDDFEESATTMESFVIARGYPVQLVRDGRRKAASTSRAHLLAGKNANQTATNRVPMVTTYHPKHSPSETLRRNHNILADDDSAKLIYSQPPLKAYRQAKNLTDMLVPCDFPAQTEQEPGTYPCGRTICRTRPHFNQSTSIPSPGGQIKITGHFACTTDNIIYCISCCKWSQIGGPLPSTSPRRHSQEK